MIAERTIMPDALFIEMFEPGFRRAADELLEKYYNARTPDCPSYLSYLEDDDDSAIAEYEHLVRSCSRAIGFFAYTNEAREIVQLLRVLNPDHTEPVNQPDPRFQLSLNFPGSSLEE
jgi:hypothetical protein